MANNKPAGQFIIYQQPKTSKCTVVPYANWALAQITPMYSKEEINKARKQVKKKKEFYQHLMSYVTVNSFLIALNLLTAPGRIWFVFPMMGWGIAIMFHYVDVFGIPGFGMLDKDWEERELENELRRMRGDDLPRLPESNKEELKLKELRKNYDESEFV